MNEQKSAEAVVVTETGVIKGRTGYAASRRQSLVECRIAEISPQEGCHPKSRTESGACGWWCADIGGICGVDESGAGHADGAGACTGQPQACVSPRSQQQGRAG